MKIIISIAAGLVVLFFLIRFLEQKTLYVPFKKIEANPKDIGLEYEEVTVTTKDGQRITGWFVPARNSRATVLFSHGNGGNISHRLEKISMMNFLNVSVLIYDYRGYGKSTGSPSEEGLYLDSEAMYDYLVNVRHISPAGVVAYGESLGGAVAIDLAAKHELAGLIIESGFTSAKAMGKKIFPVIPESIYKSSFDSLRKIKKIHCPKLIFHSTDDEIIPFDQGKRLFDEAPEPKEFVELKGGHNDAFLDSREQFIGKIDSFISGL